MSPKRQLTNMTLPNHASPFKAGLNPEGGPGILDKGDSPSAACKTNFDNLESPKRINDVDIPNGDLTDNAPVSLTLVPKTYNLFSLIKHHTRNPFSKTCYYFTNLLWSELTEKTPNPPVPDMTPKSTTRVGSQACSTLSPQSLVGQIVWTRVKLRLMESGMKKKKKKEKRRPVLVIAYDQHHDHLICCPLTSKRPQGLEHKYFTIGKSAFFKPKWEPSDNIQVRDQHGRTTFLKKNSWVFCHPEQSTYLKSTDLETREKNKKIVVTQSRQKVIKNVLKLWKGQGYVS